MRAFVGLALSFVVAACGATPAPPTATPPSASERPVAVREGPCTVEFFDDLTGRRLGAQTLSIDPREGLAALRIEGVGWTNAKLLQQSPRGEVTDEGVFHEENFPLVMAFREPGVHGVRFEQPAEFGHCVAEFHVLVLPPP